MASLIFERISSSSSSSSYSFSTHGRKYDVFLSFRSEETRHGFTDHLYEELIRKRIHVFRDDEKLQRGEVVALELMKAIEESQYAIVVLSEKFADSKRCLDELAKIVECREKTGLSIFPVFDHVDPSDVHNQKGPFETVFAKHETDDSVTIEKKLKWMDALRDVSNISGWCLHDRSESTIIQNIVERMHSELYGEFESVSKDLVGMESSIEGVIDLLGKGSDDVRFIGIWGCGGVGKTTLAQVIYCKISDQFDTKSFICFGSVGQTKNDYLVPIQKLLLSNIFAKSELNITSVHEGKKVIKQMLCSRKVLIILDNVNDKGQLDAIAESRDWFGAGSRLIITSRDKQLLTSYNVDMYEAKTLDNDKALELFSQKAFKQPHPKKDFVDLSNDFVKYAQGLPLFLEVFGSSLHKEGIEVWKIFLDQLNKNSSGEIMERLEISYKRILDQKAKELFLDIAFFYKGMDKNRVADILNDPSYWENINILKKKSLITILGRKIWMHDLLQEMGKEIVRREAPQEPGIRSRLWHHKDIFSILKNNTGTKRVEGMILNCPPNKEDLNANCFLEMTRLRLINICNVLLPHGLNYLSNELQMLEWNDYPLKFIPRNFRPNNLVELIMHHSHIEQLPKEFTNLDQLKLMDLSYSQNLIKTPDFIGFRNLERLIFQGCTRLYKVQPSVVSLRWLTLLNLKDCKHLKSLPYEIDLESLEIFILSGCSRLKKFSEIGRNMTRLSELYLDGTAIEELPPSIKHLTGLTLLNLKDCNDLLSFPSVICSLTSLEILTLSGCRGRPRKPLHLLGLSPMASSIGVNLTFKGTILLLILSFLVLPYNYLSIFVCATLIIWAYCFLNARYPEPEPINLLLPKSFSGLSSLKSLDLSDCNLSDGALPEDLSCLSSLRFLNLSKNNFTFLPGSISQLSKLKLLCLDNCSNLQSLPYLPSSTNFVMARGCTSLENYSKKVVVWASGETGFTFINCLSLVEEEDKITEVSLLGSLLEDEGSKRTEVSLLDIHFQPLWQRYMEDQIRESDGFCCVLPQSEITEWFKNQNCGSYVLIPLHRYNISLRGIALCVDFEVHKNSNEVSPGQDAKFICRLYMDGAPRDPIVYTVPRDKICVGSFGIWLYISHKSIREVDQCDCIRPLIRTNSADIEIKRCGARMLYESDVVGFVQHLSQNIFGSPDDLRRPSEDIIKCRDDKVESSQSNALIDPSPRLRSALWSWLSRLYEGDHARHHYYDYIFPQIAIPRDWFRYQNLESFIKMELPPNLHDNSTWMGFTIFASYTVDKQRAGWSYEQNSTIFLHFYSFSASEEVPLAPSIAFPLARDVFDESSRRLLVFYIPRARFQLNCFSHIWASFGSDNPVVKVDMCGIRIVYEQDVEQFVQTLVQCMLEIPVAYHPSLYQNLLHQPALLQDCNHERGFCSSFLSERRPQTMPKLLPTNEVVAEEDCTSPKIQVIAMSSGNSSPFKYLDKLKLIDLEHSISLIRTPDFTGVPRLEKLCLRGCINLVEIHPSIGQLSKLTVLNLKFCQSLINLPNSMDSLRSLEILILLGCSKLANLPENLGKIESLKELDLTGAAIREVPSSISFLICRGCEKQFFKSRLDSVFCVHSLKYLALSTNNLIFALPASISQLPKLEALDLGNCIQLHSLPDLPSNVRYINAKGCSSLEPSPALLSMSNLLQPSISFFNCCKLVEYNEGSDGLAFAMLKRYLQGLIYPKTGLYETSTRRKDRSRAAFQIIIPGLDVPQWLTHQRIGYSISIELPPNWCNSRWMGFSLCALFRINCYGYSSERYSLKGHVKALGDMPHHTFKVIGETSFEVVIGETSFDYSVCHLWLLYWSRDDLLGTHWYDLECSRINVVFDSNSPSVEVIKCAVRLIYEQDVKEFNQTIAQGSSCVITSEDSDFVHEFENSAVVKATKIVRTYDDNNEAERSASWGFPGETERAMDKTKDEEKESKSEQFRWSKPMQYLLIEILANDATKGNKPSNTFMPGSLALAAQTISEKFGVECRPNHVENCLLTIESIWSTITQLRNRKNTFGWNDNLKMITCEKKVYDEEVMAHPDHEQYLNKKIEMFDKMALIFCKDMATWSSAKSFCDIDSKKMIVDLELNDIDIDFKKASKGKQVCSSNADFSGVSSHRKRSCLYQDSYCDKFSKQLQKVELAIKKLKKDQLDVNELYEEVMKIEGFDEVMLASAFDHLVDNEKAAKAFMVKNARLRTLWLECFFNKNGNCGN